LSVNCRRSVVVIQVSSSNTTDRHDMPDILLKVALNIITLILNVGDGTYNLYCAKHDVLPRVYMQFLIVSRKHLQQ
jgi:hypothetical protein